MDLLLNNLNDVLSTYKAMFHSHQKKVHFPTN